MIHDGRWVAGNGGGHESLTVIEQQGHEVVTSAVAWDTMSAELYVMLVAQGRVSPTGLATFGTEGMGLGEVSYELVPQLDGTVLATRALPFGDPK